MNRNFGVVALLSVLFLVACGSTEEVISSAPSEGGVPLEYSVIAKGVLHGAGEEGIVNGLQVIRSAEAWEALKSQMDAVNAVSASIKDGAVDFSAEILIAYFDQVLPNGSYAVKIENVVEYSTHIEVIVRATHDDGPTTSVMVQPYTVITLPRQEKELLLKRVDD